MLLSSGDVSSILRLLGAIAISFRDGTSSKRQLLSGLAQIVEADVWTWTLQHASPGQEPGQIPVIEGGWARESQKLLWLSGLDAPESAILNDALAHHLGEHCTLTRSNLFPDATWRASGLFRRYREPEGLDDFLISLFPIASDVQSAVRLLRFLGRPPFTNRERDLVHVVTGAIEWLHRTDLPEGGVPSLLGLSPREKQVLYLLLQGDGCKQVGSKLAIGQHTVVHYMKRLHRHFGVHSRGELLAKFIDCPAKGSCWRGPSPPQSCFLPQLAQTRMAEAQP